MDGAGGCGTRRAAASVTLPGAPVAAAACGGNETRGAPRRPRVCRRRRGLLLCAASLCEAAPAAPLSPPSRGAAAGPHTASAPPPWRPPLGRPSLHCVPPPRGRPVAPLGQRRPTLGHGAAESPAGRRRAPPSLPAAGACQRVFAHSLRLLLLLATAAYSASSSSFTSLFRCRVGTKRWLYVVFDGYKWKHKLINDFQPEIVGAK